MSLTSVERAELSDLLDVLGPDAPTLCEGWTTRDLAAHLLVREGRPDAAVGIAVGPLAGWTKRVQDHAAGGDYTELVDKIRNGPPTFSYFRLPGLDASWNAFEYLVHHEDVRRAQPGWAPRVLPSKASDGIWARLAKGGASLMFRQASTGVTLRRPDGQEIVARQGEPMVTLVGQPVELVLQAYGRGDHAQIDILGEPDAVAAFSGGSFGV
jgi:uncharacterized protein (TIGR03085 family)